MSAKPPVGDSLLFTTNFPGAPYTHLINHKGWKVASDLEPPSNFEPRTFGLEIECLDY